MIRHFCDKCDKEINVSTTVPLTMHTIKNQILQFELCEECANDILASITVKEIKPVKTEEKPKENTDTYSDLRVECIAKSVNFGDWFHEACEKASIPYGLRQRAANIIIRNSKPSEGPVTVQLSKMTDDDILNFKNCGKVMAPFVMRIRDIAKNEKAGHITRF